MLYIKPHRQSVLVLKTLSKEFSKTMEKEQQSWRKLLGKIISNPQERQQIADALQLHPITLTRWVTNKTTPRLESLRQLLDILPSRHQKLAEWIIKEYPQLQREKSAPKAPDLEIPSSFYAQVLHTHSSSPAIRRSSTLSQLILQQLLLHLDPEQQGMTVFLVQCVPPFPQQKVQSLRKTYERSTPFQPMQEPHTCFYGAESPAGNATITGHYILIQTHTNPLEPVPRNVTDALLRESAARSAPCGSMLVSPILRVDRVAGCLCICSSRPESFTQMTIDIAQKYIELLTLAFEEDEFYQLTDLDLGIMPPYTQQHPLLVSFQQRVTRRMRQAQQEGQLFSRQEAEFLAWKEIEEQLLYQPWEE